MRTAGSRGNQAPRLGWLGAQGVGGAGTSFTEMVEALRRRQTHDGAAAMATGKQRRRVAKNGDGEVLIEWLRSKEKPRRSLSRASAKPRTATVASGSRRKIVDGELASAVTVHQNYRIAIRQNSQITPKFS